MLSVYKRRRVCVCVRVRACAWACVRACMRVLYVCVSASAIRYGFFNTNCTWSFTSVPNIGGPPFQCSTYVTNYVTMSVTSWYNYFADMWRSEYKKLCNVQCNVSNVPTTSQTMSRCPLHLGGILAQTYIGQTTKILQCSVRSFQCSTYVTNYVTVSATPL